MKRFLVLFSFVVTFNAWAQETYYRKSLSGEIVGLGLGISAQYDYMFKHSIHGFYDARIGVGGAIASDIQSYLSLPHALTYNFGKFNRYFEAGVGGTLTNEYNHGFFPSVITKYFIGPMAGYRSISPKGFQFRIYGNYLMGSYGAFPFFGIGFGKAFRKK